MCCVCIFLFFIQAKKFFLGCVCFWLLSIAPFIINCSCWAWVPLFGRFFDLVWFWFLSGGFYSEKIVRKNQPPTKKTIRETPSFSWGSLFWYDWVWFWGGALFSLSQAMVKTDFFNVPLRLIRATRLFCDFFVVRTKDCPNNRILNFWYSTVPCQHYVAWTLVKRWNFTSKLYHFWHTFLLVKMRFKISKLQQKGHTIHAT